jgi:hypothetical protein
LGDNEKKLEMEKVKKKEVKGKIDDDEEKASKLFFTSRIRWKEKDLFEFGNFIDLEKRFRFRGF